MARFLAIDWNDTECRYLLASVQKEEATVHQAGVVPLNLSYEEGVIPGLTDDLPALTLALQKVIKAKHLPACRTRICLGRSKLEILYQDLPPCRNAEIPFLLKNQVLRELPNYADFDPLDYLPLERPEEQGHHLLAVTIPLSYRQALVRSLRSIGRVPDTIGYRAIYATKLLGLALRDQTDEVHESTILADIVGSEVDLITLDGTRIVSVRSFRLPPQLGSDEAADRIAEEIRRTAAIGVDDESIQPVGKVYLFGSEEQWTGLETKIQAHDLATEVINPFLVPGIKRGEKLDALDEPGRFAPLLGSLFERVKRNKKELYSARSIDLLHPKETPKPANYIRSVLLVLFLLGIAGYGLYRWNEEVLSGMRAELTKVEAEYKEVSGQYGQVQPIWNVLREAQGWESQHVIWLDVLQELSTIMPGEEDIVITQMSFTTGPVNNNPRFAGSIQISGMVRDPAVLMTLRNQLNGTGKYLMRAPNPSRNPAGGGYPWLFQASIVRGR